MEGAADTSSNTLAGMIKVIIYSCVTKCLRALPADNSQGYDVIPSRTGKGTARIGFSGWS